MASYLPLRQVIFKRLPAFTRRITSSRVPYAPEQQNRHAIDAVLPRYWTSARRFLPRQSTLLIMLTMIVCTPSHAITPTLRRRGALSRHAVFPLSLSHAGLSFRAILLRGLLSITATSHARTRSLLPPPMDGQPPTSYRRQPLTEMSSLSRISRFAEAPHRI